MQKYINKTSGQVLFNQDLISAGIRIEQDVLSALSIFPVVDDEVEFDKDCFKLGKSTIVWDETNNRYIKQRDIVARPEHELKAHLTKLAIEKKQAILAGADAAAKSYMANFSDLERLTWNKQEAEVVAYKKEGLNASTPILDGLAASRGLPREQMILKAVAKVDLFYTLASLVIGYQQALEDQLSSIVEDPNMDTLEKISLVREIKINYQSVISQAGA